MKILKLTPLLLILGCGPVYENGNGNLSTEERSVNSFSEIRVDGQFQITLEEGRESVKVLTDENLHKYIEVFVEGDVLYIESTERIRSDDGIKIFIDYEHLEALELRGAPAIGSESTIKSSELELSVDGAAVIDLDINVRDLRIEISGAGLMELSGRARDMMVEMSGTGNLSAYDLEVEIAEIELSGVGAAQVNVRERLLGEVTGVGSIKYKGNPEIVETDVSGLGTVSPSSEKDKSDVDIDI